MIGWLNLYDMTLIPHKVFPKGPRGELESVINLVPWTGQGFINKFIENIAGAIRPAPAALAG